ncbi:23S rRNA (adenine2503-C2)-methyltransferase [Seinonella peptonophila]|uniref:Probable dual-specificity RNA methyltransferase RlmN n=1 Tax=Seinonella peptonophila TaxID=112248 RepID=A0A1M4UVQ9_9BACL|nr:23S rRNA (adenine(2503)-C(2))-methyltransferase RlmN [Seinonella peptonophila]SHE60775.1 23S rRNA (adenine2503-C2)-methyltransferase [Seinonella peptonophila]
MKKLAYDLLFHEWEEWLQKENQPVWRAKQLMDWLYQKQVKSFAEMTNLSKELRGKLDEQFEIQSLDTITIQKSTDGTIKFLFSLHDGHAIETVIMRHDYGNSVCVTTQVGCRIGCTFCASTLGGLKRNLTAGEITAQVVMAARYLTKQNQRVRSIVIMGIGEPFENYDQTIRFLRTMIDPHGLQIGQRHITVSTSGIVPNIYRFTDENWQIGLAISLHAPNQKLRRQLMPVSRRYPLSELLKACHYYVEQTSRRLTFEYALINEKNDHQEHAHELGQLLQGFKCLVNLIPVNYVPERGYTRTPRNRIFTFKRILESYHVQTTIRREHGHDIDAACGQLRSKHAQQQGLSV